MKKSASGVPLIKPLTGSMSVRVKGASRNDRYRSLKVPIKDIYLLPLVKRFRDALGDKG